MKKNYIIIACCFLCACVPEKQNAYLKMEREGLKSGLRYDSLFMGYYFGMPQADFFKHSWDLNKKQLITNGQGAEILLKPQGFSSAVSLSFYPVFKQGRISEMPFRLSYDGWSPIHPQLSQDSLLKESLRVVSAWFGVASKDFVRVKDAKSSRWLYANVMGNRRIVLFKEGEMFVKVNVTDLTRNQESLF